MDYLVNGFRLKNVESVEIAETILDFTRCHPYYTQQLAFMVWEMIDRSSDSENYTEQAINEIIRMHDMDYERLWGTFNKTDKKLMIGISESGLTPLSEAFYRKYGLGAPSTVFSSLKRIMNSGYIIKLENKYEIDDPFFSRWIAGRRNL